MSGGDTGRASPLFIHSFQAVLCNVPVDNGRKDKPLRGSACDRAYGARAAHLQSFQSRQLVFYRYVSLFYAGFILADAGPEQGYGLHNHKGQGAGPLRLLTRCAVQSSSPTPPGPLLRTVRSPPNPCGFRAIRLGSDGEGQHPGSQRPCRSRRLHRAG